MISSSAKNWTPSPNAFPVGNLWVQVSDREDDGVLNAFYPSYDSAFILENEKEGIDGFESCLQLNRGYRYSTLTELYGPFREIVLVARTSPSGPVLGGANLLVASPHPEDDICYAANLNYLFVVPAARGTGLSRKLLMICNFAASRIAASWDITLGTKVGPMFLEVNDPFRLTQEQYRADSDHSGIDQVDRLGYWGHLGAAIVPFPYIQPALSATQGNDETLAIAIIANGSLSLKASTFKRHLERFFGISVLKGRPLESSPIATTLLSDLCAMNLSLAPLQLLPLAGRAMELKELLARSASERPASLSDALLLQRGQRHDHQR